MQARESDSKKLFAMQGTVLMALLQPAPEVYDLFDDILLLCEGGCFTLSPVFGVRLPKEQAAGWEPKNM